MRRMYGGAGDDVFYYVTLYNENYPMPARRPDVTDDDIMGGLYRYAEAPNTSAHQATIVFSGTAHLAATQAQHDLAEHFGVAAELWSATSYKILREEALSVERWNRLHPAEEPRTPYVTERLRASSGPLVAVTDFMKMVPDQIARWVPNPGFVPLGTDGFGRSDTREALRRFFETDAAHVVVATLAALADQGALDRSLVGEAIKHYDLDPDLDDPRVR
jgi:pyruvate dehydrogenase E1 component